MLKQWLVSISQRFPVVSMHILDVEKVAKTAPDFIEYLFPFLLGIDRHAQLRGGNILALVMAQFVNLEVASLTNENRLIVRGQVIARDTFHKNLLLTVLMTEDDEHRIHVAFSPVEEWPRIDIDQVPLRGAEAEYVIGVDGHLDHALAQAIEVDF